ncbi:MAG: ATP-dependent Clp protease ATP-binding subunit ClpX, partial [Syntrophobacteraceae bacterium CG07_land_8_20_14_0_80_61_8]
SRKSGARGLRSIMENIMLDIMYELPSQTEVEECLISEESIVKHEQPLLLYRSARESA